MCMACNLRFKYQLLKSFIKLLNENQYVDFNIISLKLLSDVECSAGGLEQHLNPRWQRSCPCVDCVLQRLGIEFALRWRT